MCFRLLSVRPTGMTQDLGPKTGPVYWETHETASLADLGSALGISHTELGQPSTDAYLQYVASSWPGKGSKSSFIRLLAKVVTHFQGMAHAVTLQAVPKFRLEQVM
jgi:hypothetical protein